jgi:hypothetical protein
MSLEFPEHEMANETVEDLSDLSEHMLTEAAALVFFNQNQEVIRHTVRFDLYY